MTADGQVATRHGFFSSLTSLLLSSSTLVCCALPALLVAIGAGAALSSLVSVFPQIVWLSEHKEALFTVAGLMMAGAGWLQWRGRTAPCPVDPALRSACMRTHKVSRHLYWMSLGIYLIGAWFAFVQPLLGG